MKEPIKIIWKYKNENRRIQYNMYIFIGNVSNDIKKILESITELTLYETFIKIDKVNYVKLEKFYGEKWYLHFFNTYHINSIIYNIAMLKL